MVDCMEQRNCACLAPVLIVLASCGPADNDPGPGGVTVGEARALDEAAAMIDQRRLPDSALPENTGEAAPLPPEAGSNRETTGSEQ